MPNINLPLAGDLLKRVDEARGDVPRVAWIRRAIEHRLQRQPEPLIYTATIGSSEAPPVPMPMGPAVDAARASRERLRGVPDRRAKADVQPIPKRGK